MPRTTRTRPLPRRAAPLALVCALSLLSAAAAHAAASSHLDDRYFLRTWRRSDGLPGNSVYAIAQSEDGYLWVGTEKGLVRFDGHRFTSIAMPQPTGRCVMVMSLAAGRDGTLWVGTGRGLFRLRGDKLVADPAGGPLAEAEVSALAEDAGGDLWIGTRSGLWRRGAATGRLTLAGIVGARVDMLLPGEPGAMWIGTEAHGAWRFRAGRLEPVTADPRLLRKTVTGLVRDLDGSILAFTENDARRFGDGATVTLAPGEVPPVQGVIAAGAGDGSLWFGTGGQGVVQVRGGRILTASPGHQLASGLAFRIFVAADRTVWLGTAGDGLRQLVEKSCRTYTRADGLGGDTVVSVLAEQGQELWVGTFSGVNRLSRRFDNVSVGATELPGMTVWSLLRDRQGTLWAGTSRGLARRAASGWQFRPLWGANANAVVDTLYEDAAGNLWIGTGAGLGMMAPGAGRVMPVDGLAGQEITGIAEDAGGALWVGTRGAGLLRLRDGRLEPMLPAAELPIVTAVQRGQANDMWVGSFGAGLLHFHDGHWSRLDERSGLDDNTVRQLREDPLGNLWICSGAGISRVARRVIDELEAHRATALVPFSYGPEDGVVEGVCYGGSHPGVARTGDGHLWFATNHGLVEIRPERQAPPLLGLAPRLDRVTADGRDLRVGPRAALALLASVRRLDLRFSAPVFVAGRRTAFRYRLVGLDTDWIADDGSRLARFTMLDPGSYRFEVAMRDESGNWSDAATLATIEVKPLFYESSSFVALIGLAVLGLAFGCHRLAAGRLRRRAAQLTAMVDERTVELQEANRQLEALATIDPLTGLANRRVLNEAKQRELQRAARNGSMLSLVMVDVDYFKRYNDSLGHVGGDQCLREVARVLAAVALRPADVVVRYGGEEFALLLPETPAAAAASLAEELRCRIEALAIPHPTSPVADHVTVSAGVFGLVPEAAFAPDDLVRAADQALYRAKQQGRNRVVVAERPGHEPTHVRLVQPAA